MVKRYPKEWIADLCRARGLTSKELAALVGVSLCTVNDWRRKNGGSPGADSSVALWDQEKKRPAPAYKGKIHKLGDKWLCECGEPHILSNAYLAAHWNEPLEHKCPACCRRHIVKSGIIKMVKI